MKQQLIPSVLDRTNNSDRISDIYSRLLSDRIIFINGTIDDELASVVIAQLLYLEFLDSTLDIHLYINSPGGSVTAGLAIIDVMNYIRCDVATFCIGIAASMGALLLSSGKKGKRFALMNSEIMIHQVLGNVQGQATDIEIATRRILKTKDKLNFILADNSERHISEVAKDTERDYYMSAIEAKDYGLIDDVKLSR